MPLTVTYELQPLSIEGENHRLFPLKNNTFASSLELVRLCHKARERTYYAKEVVENLLYDCK